MGDESSLPCPGDSHHGNDDVVGAAHSLDCIAAILRWVEDYERQGREFRVVWLRALFGRLIPSRVLTCWVVVIFGWLLACSGLNIDHLGDIWAVGARVVYESTECFNSVRELRDAADHRDKVEGLAVCGRETGGQRSHIL